MQRGFSHDEHRLHVNAVRAGIASARIEGGDVGPEARAIMSEWAHGLIDNDTMTARIDALHEWAPPFRTAT